MKQDQNCRDGQRLRENIATACAVRDIKWLLDLGATFKEASPRTRRAWDRTAARRTQELCPT